MTAQAARTHSEPHHIPSAPHHIRPAVPGDLNFVLGTWTNSHWQESPWANRLRWPIYKRGHERIIRSLLARSHVLVAHEPGDENEILGYFVFEPQIPAAHWCYVKPHFRKEGVARALLAHSGLPLDLTGVTITHPTRAWFTVQAQRGQGGVILRPAKLGLEEKFPLSQHDPYGWMIMETQ